MVAEHDQKLTEFDGRFGWVQMLLRVQIVLVRDLVFDYLRDRAFLCLHSLHEA